MIVLCGVRELPSGPRTEAIAAHLAERLNVPLDVVDGTSAAAGVQRAADEGAQAVVVGHVPERNAGAALREAPCPVAVAPAGPSPSDWDAVLLACPAGRPSARTAELAAALAARLRVPMSDLRGHSPDEVLGAARQGRGGLIVAPADPRPRLMDRLRPLFTADLLDRRPDVVVVVPEG